jgi:hypothetical protein
MGELSGEGATFPGCILTVLSVEDVGAGRSWLGVRAFESHPRTRMRGGLWVKLLSQSICRIIGVYLLLSLYLNMANFSGCIKLTVSLCAGRSWLGVRAFGSRPCARMRRCAVGKITKQINMPHQRTRLSDCDAK